MERVAALREGAGDGALIRVDANEASWTRHDQLSVIKAGAADVISADNQADGGLLNLKRSAGICEAAGLPVVKHSLGVELDRDKVARYAELYRTDGADFSFGSPDIATHSPALPKV